MLEQWIAWTLVLLAGLSLGSFVTLASWRLPREEDVVLTPSRCPACRTRLTVRDLVPLFSWLLARGACRHCGAKISRRYPLIELLTAALVLAIYFRHGFTPETALLSLLGVSLLILIVTDLEHFLIPDELHWAMLALGLTYALWTGRPWEEVLAGFLLGMGTGLLLHHGYRWLRHKEGLGFGDVKFFAVAGLWLGLKPFVPFLFFSGLFGVCVGLAWRVAGKGAVFPFGPALALALLLGVAWPEIYNLFWNISMIIR